MEEHVEREGMEHLEHIDTELGEIKERTPTKTHAFAYGLWQGAGALLGGILALTLIGWLLTAFGVVPGFGNLAKYFQGIVSAFRR